jgi:hypothetical protein
MVVKLFIFMQKSLLPIDSTAILSQRQTTCYFVTWSAVQETRVSDLDLMYRQYQYLLNILKGGLENAIAFERL